MYILGSNFKIVSYIDYFSKNFYFSCPFDSHYLQIFFTFFKIGHGKALKESQLKSVSYFDFIIFFIHCNIISYYSCLGMKFSHTWINVYFRFEFSDCIIYCLFSQKFQNFVSVRLTLSSKFRTFFKIGHSKTLKKCQLKSV